MSEIQKRKHYLYLNADGLPEAVDLETGEIFPMEIQSKDLHRYRSQVVEGQRIWIPFADIAPTIKYSPLFADSFVEGILAGRGIRRVCDENGISYKEYVQLRKAYPEFGELVDEARKDRAELFFEKIEEVAEQTEADEEEIALGRLKVDAYKHLAEVADPGKFGKKTQLTGKVGVGIIQIETGIRRTGDPGFIHPQVVGDIEEGQRQIEKQDLEVATVAINPNKLPSKVE